MGVSKMERQRGTGSGAGLAGCGGTIVVGRLEEHSRHVVQHT